MDTTFYNQASAAKLGWEPIWFGAMEFGEQLAEEIKGFQKKYDLKADGLCGPVTYRRIFTARQALMELTLDKYNSKIEELEDGKRIICSGQGVPINWEKVVNLMDNDSLALPASCHEYSGHEVRKPTMIVTHWDAALSANSCYKILRNRGISSHFVIDNDGTIYQMVDTQNAAWHAGIYKVNQTSIGIDFSNAYYTKYQKYYEKKGHGPRPVLTESQVHGTTLDAHLGYYPVQVEAYKALVKSLSDHYDIPLECPMESGELITTVHEPSVAAEFKGVVSHYHLTKRKIDCAGLPLDEILGDLRN